MKQPDKWKIVENVALAIEEAYCAFQRDVHIERDAHVSSVSDPSSKRQIDILISVIAGNRRLLVGVEVKAQSRPLNKPAIDGVCGKLDDTELDRITVVSASGFTKSARLRAKRDKRIDLVELSEVPVVRGNTASPTVTPVWLKYRIKAANLSWSDPKNGIPPELMTTFNLAQVDVEFSDGERMTLLDVIVRVIPTAIMQIQPPPVDSFFVDCRELDWKGLHAGGVRYARPDSYQVLFSWNMERSKIERYMRFTTAMGLDVTTQVWFDGARFVQTSAVHRVGEMGSHIHISNHPLESRTGRKRSAEGP